MENRLSHHSSRGLNLVMWNAVMLVLLAGCTAQSPVEQPVPYPHRLHVAQEEIACTECHIGAETATHATIPDETICLDCHEEAMGESPAEAQLVALLAAGEPIPWVRVTRVTEQVHFSHRRHVLAGQILCETCHGDVHTMEAPFTRPFISFKGRAGMERCIACHQESGNPRAVLDCALCHM